MTRKMPVSGPCMTPVTMPVIPVSTKAVSSAMPSTGNSCTPIPNASPTPLPMTRLGANTPPTPPLPSVMPQGNELEKHEPQHEQQRGTRFDGEKCLRGDIPFRKDFRKSESR